MPGKTYKIIKPFENYDKGYHDVGETWIFNYYNFVPHEDGLSLFISIDGGPETQIRMQWRPEEQTEILDNFEQYIEATDSPKT